MKMRNKNFWPVIVLAFVLRVLISATTYHPDLRATEFASFDIVENGHLTSFYDTLHRLPPESPLVKSLGPDELNYPPLAYLAPTAFRFLLRPIFSPQKDLAILTGPEHLFENPSFFGYLLLLKLPNFFPDFVLAWAITFFFSRQEQKKLAAFLWLFNPLTLYATFAIGQLDIWPTALTVLAGVFLVKKKPLPAVLLLGLGGGYKLFPLLLLLPTAIAFGHSLFGRLCLLAGGLAVYAAVVLPFLLTSPGYRSTALLAPQVDKMLFAHVNVSGDQYLSFFIVGYVLLLAFSFSLPAERWLTLWVGILVIFFAVTNYHPQWFLWLTPWLIILVLKNDLYLWPSLTLLVADIAITLSFDPSLHYGLLSPLVPSLSQLPYTLPSLLGKVLPFPTIVSLVRSTLAAIGTYLIYLLAREKFSV